MNKWVKNDNRELNHMFQALAKKIAKDSDENQNLDESKYNKLSKAVEVWTVNAGFNFGCAKIEQALKLFHKKYPVHLPSSISPPTSERYKISYCTPTN